MLYDTTTTPDDECPSNVRIGYDGKTVSILIPKIVAEIAGLKAGDYLCVRKSGDEIDIFKSVKQQQGLGRSKLIDSPRANGNDYLSLTTTAVEFRVESFSRCGVITRVPGPFRLRCASPSKENMSLPKTSRKERSVKFDFKDVCAFLGALGPKELEEQMRELFRTEPEMFRAIVKGLESVDAG